MLSLLRGDGCAWHGYGKRLDLAWVRPDRFLKRFGEAFIGSLPEGGTPEGKGLSAIGLVGRLGRRLSGRCVTTRLPGQAGAAQFD